MYVYIYIYIYSYLIFYNNFTTLTSNVQPLFLASIGRLFVRRYSNDPCKNVLGSSTPTVLTDKINWNPKTLNNYCWLWEHTSTMPWLPERCQLRFAMLPTNTSLNRPFYRTNDLGKINRIVAGGQGISSFCINSRKLSMSRPRHLTRMQTYLEPPIR